MRLRTKNLTFIFGLLLLSSTGVACQSPDDQLLLLQLEQAELLLEHRANCGVMAEHLGAFLNKHDHEINRLYKAVERDRLERTQSNDEPLGVPVHTSSARETLRAGHAARHGCMKNEAMQRLVRQRWELL